MYMNRSDTVITPSEKLAGFLRGEYGYKGEMQVIPTGLDLSEFEGLSVEPFYAKFPSLKGKRLLLSAGRIGKEKNFGYLVEAMRHLREERDTVLVIAGTGRHASALQEEAADLVSEGRVMFAGLLDREEMLSAYEAAELFVFASETDTQGMVLSETVAAGTPVVMTDDPSLSEAIVEGKTALVAPGDDAAAFADVVRGLLGDEQKLSALATGCREHAENLSISKSIDALLKAYEHVISDHQATSWRSRARETLAKDVRLPEAMPGVKQGFIHIGRAVKGAKKLFTRK